MKRALGILFVVCVSVAVGFWVFGSVKHYRGEIDFAMRDGELGQYAVIVKDGDSKFVVVGGPQGTYIPFRGESFMLVTESSLQILKDAMGRVVDDSSYPALCRYDRATGDIDGVWRVVDGVSMFRPRK